MLVALDPGHGGADRGAVHDGFIEATLTLDLCEKIADRAPFVRLTRETDRALTHEARAEAAANFGCGAAVSIHFNAGSVQQRGPELYYLGSLPKFFTSLTIQSQHARMFDATYYQRTDDPNWKYLRRSETVIKPYKIPAVLIEVGYLTDASFRAGLRSGALDTIAKDIALWIENCVTRGAV